MSKTIEVQPGLNALRNVIIPAISLCRNTPGSPIDKYRPVYLQMAHAPEEYPLNTWEDILYEMTNTVEKRGLVGELDDPLRPYWLGRGEEYGPCESLGVLVQFADQHNATVPYRLIPPEADVMGFINKVCARPGRVKIPDQFEMLLDITGNSVLGSAHLGFLANRIMARGADQKIYPGITVDERCLKEWNKKIAQFETYGNDGKCDGPGDNYYFWTHFFAAYYYNKCGKQGVGIMDWGFEHGTEIMGFVKHVIARKGIISNHYESTQIGRAMGLALSELT